MSKKQDVRFALIPHAGCVCEQCLMIGSRDFEFTKPFNPHKGKKLTCKCEFMPGVKGKTKIEGYNPSNIEDQWRAAVKVRKGTGLSEHEAKALLDRLGVTTITSEKADDVVSLWKKAVKCQSKPLMMSYEDPLEDLIGSAEKTDPERLAEIINTLERNGVEITITRKGGDMSYGASATKGSPGNMKMARGASIAAWEHEFQHFLDDMEMGYPGLSKYFRNIDMWIEMERRAYKKEIEIAIEKGYPELKERYEMLLALEEARWQL